MIFSYINDNFVKFYRTTRKAITTPDAFWEAAYPDPEFRETIKNKILEDIASGDPERMYWEDVPIVRTGEEITFVTARNTFIRSSGLMLSTVWDTTERKRAEETLCRWHQYLLSLQETSSELVAQLDWIGC